MVTVRFHIPQIVPGHAVSIISALIYSLLCAPSASLNVRCASNVVCCSVRRHPLAAHHHHLLSILGQRK